MNLILPTRMTVDKFLRWSQEQEDGRYELEQGRVVMRPSQNAGHIRTKHRVHDAWIAAIAKAGLPYYVMGDGILVRTPGARAYQPDALIAPLPEVPDDTLEVANPIIVCEVLSPSPSSQRRDLVTKAIGYALVPTIEHYVIIDPVDRVVLHDRRDGVHLIQREELTEGTLRLDPPGLEIPIAEMLVPGTA